MIAVSERIYTWCDVSLFGRRPVSARRPIRGAGIGGHPPESISRRLPERLDACSARPNVQRKSKATFMAPLLLLVGQDRECLAPLIESKGVGEHPREVNPTLLHATRR